MPYPAHQPSRSFKRYQRTAGDITVNTTTWAEPVASGGADLTLLAEVGDTILMGAAIWWQSAAIIGWADLVTIVSSAVVDSLFTSPVSNSTAGIPTWAGISGVDCGVGAPVLSRPLVAGDLSSGYVTVRPRLRLNSAGTRLVSANTGLPFTYWVQNVGPVDPN